MRNRRFDGQIINTNHRTVKRAFHSSAITRSREDYLINQRSIGGLPNAIACILMKVKACTVTTYTIKNGNFMIWGLSTWMLITSWATSHFQPSRMRCTILTAFRYWRGIEPKCIQCNINRAKVAGILIYLRYYKPLFPLPVKEPASIRGTRVSTT